jgi:methyl-accepting chemotaxis protein
MSEQRRQVFIHAHVQQSRIVEVLLSAFLLTNLIVIVGFVLFNALDDVQRFQRVYAVTVVVLELAGFYAIYRYSLAASHRIAGPLYVIGRCLKAMEGGDLSIDMRLRKDDQLQEIAEQMNTTLHQLRLRIANLQHLAGRLPGAGPEQAALVQRLNQELAFFNTEQHLTLDDSQVADAGPSFS